MILKNNTKRKYVHSYFDKNYKLQLLVLEPQHTLEVPEEVAASWLKVAGIEEYIAPEKVKEEKEKLLKQVEQLKKENAQLKDDKNNKPKASKPKAKTSK